MGMTNVKYIRDMKICYTKHLYKQYLCIHTLCEQNYWISIEVYEGTQILVHYLQIFLFNVGR